MYPSWPRIYDPPASASQVLGFLYSFNTKLFLYMYLNFLIEKKDFDVLSQYLYVASLKFEI
jgi:hypothetical protein